MADIHQEQPYIRNMQVVSSNRVHSTRVRPINVGFSNRFFCLSDKRCLMIDIKKNVEEYKS